MVRGRGRRGHRDGGRLGREVLRVVEGCHRVGVGRAGGHRGVLVAGDGRAHRRQGLRRAVAVDGVAAHAGRARVARRGPAEVDLRPGDGRRLHAARDGRCGGVRVDDGQVVHLEAVADHAAALTDHEAQGVARAGHGGGDRREGRPRGRRRDALLGRPGDRAGLDDLQAHALAGGVAAHGAGGAERLTHRGELRGLRRGGDLVGAGGRGGQPSREPTSGAVAGQRQRAVGRGPARHRAGATALEGPVLEQVDAADGLGRAGRQGHRGDEGHGDHADPDHGHTPCRG